MLQTGSVYSSHPADGSTIYSVSVSSWDIAGNEPLPPLAAYIEVAAGNCYLEHAQCSHQKRGSLMLLL